MSGLLIRHWAGGVVAALVCGTMSTAASAALVTVNDLQTRNEVSYNGGATIYSGGGGDAATGTFDGVTGGSSIAGTDTVTGPSFMLDPWTYTVDWDQSQTISITPAPAGAISAAGSTSLTLRDSTATAGITGWNNQGVGFTVSDATPYSLDGSIAGGQTVELTVFSAAAGKYVRVFLAYIDGPFSKTGTLQAGDYWIQNSPYTFVADGAPAHQDNNWTWTLSFPDADVQSSIVPEPSSLALGMMAAVLLAGGRRRTTLRR